MVLIAVGQGSPIYWEVAPLVEFDQEEMVRLSKKLGALRRQGLEPRSADAESHDRLKRQVDDLLGKWGRPDNRNEGGYDFVYAHRTEDQVALRFVDTTVAPSHDLKTRYVEELVAAFGLCYHCCGLSFFFVVPKNRVCQFKVGTVDAQSSTGLLQQLGWPNRQETSMVKVAGFCPAVEFQ
jgi:hypothetical protein